MNERSIFMEALDFEEPRERSAYIDRACGGDECLRARVEVLLRRHHANDKLVLDRMPAIDPTATEDMPRPAEEPGNSIGPYKLREQIGEGGMGVVYVAEQTQPVRRKVALKIIKPGMDTKQVIARFEAERQALAMMDHPNIAKVHDAGTTDSGRPYFVMELVRGIPITDYCDREQVAIPERLELFILVCRAVQHAHQKGIIHRDLKPSNILVTIIDGVPVPKIIDFGVAKATGASLTERTIYTAFQQFIGTPLYISPEQADLAGMDVDTRSDIYSLGVLLYELLTGTTPFDHETFRQAAFDELRRIIREPEPPKPSTRLSSLGATRATVSANRKADARQLDRAIRGELDWIVMKALEKDRRRRYESANDFASDVMRYLTDQPVEACPPSPWYRFRKFASRNRRSLATTALLAVAGLIIGGVLISVQLQKVSRVRQVGQEVRQALAGARTAIEAGDLTLAGQRVAQAQGHLGLERDRLPAVAADVDRIRHEIEVRQADAARFSQFLKGASDAQDKMGLNHDPVGERLAEETLRLYGIVTEKDWSSRLERCYLTAGQRQQVREAAYVTLVSLADSHVRWAGSPGHDPAGFARSLEFLQRAQAFHQPTRAFYFVRAQCRRQQGDAAAAAEDERQFKATVARTAWDYYLPGDTADWQGDLDEAIRAYHAALRLQPDHFNSLFFLAWLFDTDKINRRPEAVQLWTACIALRPDDFLAYNNRGVCHDALRQLDDAIADFRQTLRLRPDRAEPHVGLAQALEKQGKLDEAIAEWREGIRLKPADAGYQNDLGILLAKQGKVDEAVAALREAIRLETGCAEARSNIGIVLATQGRLDEAVAEFREAIRLKPDFAGARADLAWCLANSSDPGFRDPPRAVEAARKAVELAPQDSNCWNTLGAALFRAGEWKAAISALEKSETLAPGKDLALNGFFLAMAHWRFGHKDQARRWYDKAAAWKPKNKFENEELLRFRAEAAALLGLADLPADVFGGR
jgi:serine/threonine protein kinase/tetratricopeptide (TPR) repeat protein